MAYASKFYKQKNIIGYTGDINNSPTVYFKKDNTFGHITQQNNTGLSDDHISIGRNIVMTDHHHIRNTLLIEGAHRYAEYIREQQLFIASTDFKPLSDANAATLAKSIENQTELKAKNKHIRYQAMLDYINQYDPDTDMEMYMDTDIAMEVVHNLGVYIRNAAYRYVKETYSGNSALFKEYTPEKTAIASTGSAGTGKNNANKDTEKDQTNSQHQNFFALYGKYLHPNTSGKTNPDTPKNEMTSTKANKQLQKK